MEESKTEKINNYSSTNHSPEIFQNFIDKYVQIHVIKNLSYSGFVNSIDPVSYSVILSVPTNKSYRTVLIPGYAITELAEIQPANEIEPPKRKQDSELSLEEIIRLRKRMMGWFRENLLPVAEAGHNLMIGNVTVLPPYSVSDICTENPVVALQIKSIIEKMPPEYEPK